jgi:hypothetical protein
VNIPSTILEQFRNEKGIGLIERRMIDGTAASHPRHAFSIRIIRRHGAIFRARALSTRSWGRVKPWQCAGPQEGRFPNSMR